MDYNVVVLGGTFDHFHKGHKAFLHFAFAQSKHVLIGITSDTFVGEKHYQESNESFVKREQALVSFLQEHDYTARALVTSIDSADIPPSFKDYRSEAIVVTEDTKKGAAYINKKRKQEGKEPLPIIVCPLEKAEDEGYISSTRIRAGEIDREGHLFIKAAYYQQTFVLPKSLRAELHKPFGYLVSDFSSEIEKIRQQQMLERIIVVGDIITETFFNNQLYPSIAVVDLYVQRKKQFTSIKDHKLQGNEHIVTIENPAGMITPALFHAATDAVKKDTRSVIEIIGEEDLAVLPFILAAPLGWYIFYGQPHAGVVYIAITEEVKSQAQKLLLGFQRSSG